ncbi:phosphoribosylformylglycinamidine cyclo-ligase [bacterium]|nr:phosphoribosylformylglycinamidine cyclo-ligase [bacterium]
MDFRTDKRSRDNYAESGVDTPAETVSMRGFLDMIRETFSFTRNMPGEVILDLGHFANVIKISTGEKDIGIALSADGVGTKVLVAQMMGDYSTIGIDCVAMNVNDILCVGARPISMLNYLALQRIDENILSEIAKGLYEGAKQSGVAIPGGETAQVRDLIKGLEEGKGFDLAGMAIGIVETDRILTGKGIAPGDIVFGLSSSGIHSNGFSLARRVLFNDGGLKIDSMIPELGKTLGEELLIPTRIYVPVILDVMEKMSGVKAFCHITGDGLLNLLRVDSQVAFIIDHLPDPPPIFKLIKEKGGVSDREMFRVFNMGIGFCIVCAPDDIHILAEICDRHQIELHRIGFAMESQERFLEVRPFGLIGKGRAFL